ncbi:MAG TPA: hypothetical protein VLF71_04670, partial [Candidatus Saccharimonadales bacterium]|nr:hypothetical protein [Candidatus Saccharimonadales bacterium]
MENWLGVLSGVVGVAGYLPYIRDIWRRKTRPNRISWLIWTLEYSGLLAAQLQGGARGTLWLVGLQLAGVIVVFGLSLRFGQGGITRRNLWLLLAVAASLAYWFVVRSADVAVLLLLSIEASGVALTARKAYCQPQSETLAMWWLVCAAGVINLAGLGRHAAWLSYIYPAALVVMGGAVVLASRLGAQKQGRRALAGASTAAPRAVEAAPAS